MMKIGLDIFLATMILANDAVRQSVDVSGSDLMTLGNVFFPGRRLRSFRAGDLGQACTLTLSVGHSFT